MVPESPRIYNIFPRLFGIMQAWEEHLYRIRELDFNWIYLNPFQYSGFSGSLYSIKDYYGINPMFVNTGSPLSPVLQLKAFVKKCHRLGLNVMMDLVINHTAKDHPFTIERQSWYKKNEKGEIVSPGAWENGSWIEWGDLAEIDNRCSSDREGLWNYWKDLVDFYINAGFDGFRADAAYNIPAELWDILITSGKKRNRDIKFFAESLGCPIDKTIELAGAGFDFIFNSSKWWNYRDGWLLEQYEKTMNIAPSVSFPESHDTLRLAFESGGRIDLIRQRAVFTAFFSSGWMIPAGFEYGFLKKPDVVKTLPSDWENVNIDLTGFIREINSFRKKYEIFNRETSMEPVDLGPQRDIMMLVKTDLKYNESALIMINRSGSVHYSITPSEIEELRPYSKINCRCSVFPGEDGGKIKFSGMTFELEPNEAKIIYIKYL